MVIDPKRVVKMETHTDPAGQEQALCYARTDGDGAIRWFAGFGWEGQGQITDMEKWVAYLRGFGDKFLKQPYATPSFEVHKLDVP